MKWSAWLLAGEPTDDGGEHPSSRSGVGTATRTDDQGAYRKTLEVVETFGEPSGDRTRDRLIKSHLRSIPSEVHEDVRLEDLYTWD